MARFVPGKSTEEDTSIPSKIAPSTPSNFDTTSVIQIKDVPSNCLSYGKNTRIFARTYPYREVKLLSDSQLPIDKQYEILLEGITTEGFDKNSLTLYDFYWINIYRKLSSLGTQDYSLPYFCPKCKKEGQHRFKLLDIPFESLDVPSLPVKATFNTINPLTFMPITVESFIILNKNDKIYAKNGDGYLLGENGERVRDPISYLAAMCINLDFEEAYNTIANVTDRRDQRILEKIDSLLDHGMGVLEFNCSNPVDDIIPIEHPALAKHCNNKIVRGLIGGESLILPFRRDGKPDNARISFGG